MLEEMLFDQNRLWVRNLGRDDRVIASEGRELRTPFLTHEVADFANKLPCAFLAGFKEREKGSMEWQTKLLLRQLANKLGLIGAAELPKKAIQFGTGIAKESSKAQGCSHRSVKGQSKVSQD
jgi:asparagine synthetase B (glutamine-hydrolysing)